MLFKIYVFELKHIESSKKNIYIFLKLLLFSFRWTSDSDPSLKYGHPDLHLVCAHSFWKGTQVFYT